MRESRTGAWFAFTIGALYFLIPLIATFEFSLRMKRGEYSFEAYRTVFADPRFHAAFGYSVAQALATIVVGLLIIVPTAYWVRLRVPQFRPIVEFITLLPLVIPAIVIVFGYLRIFNSSSIVPLTDTGMQAIDVRTLTESAESLGANTFTILARVILPNIRSAVLSGAFLTFAIVIGEFTFAALLSRPAFGPYLQLIGANRAYEPSALAIMAFLVTWACMGLMQLAGRGLRLPATDTR